MSNIVVCNGGNRTGSTLSFNIARVLYEQAGIRCKCIGASPEKVMDMLVDPKVDTCVVKTHHWSPPDRPEIKTIHTVRDYREVMASAIMLAIAQERIYDKDMVMETLRKQRELTESLKTKTNVLFLWYGSLMEDLPEQIRMVAHFLMIHAPEGMVDRIVGLVGVARAKENCDSLQGKGDACSVTQLRKNHIGKFNGAPNMWQGIITEEMEKEINEEIGDAYSLLTEDYPNTKFMDDLEELE